MKYAVIESGGKQYKVSEGDIVDIDRIAGEKDQKTIFDKVLLYVADSDVRIGKPVVPNVKVNGVISEQKKGDKIRVQKYKAKARYHRTTGFRALLTTVKITEIDVPGAIKKQVKEEKVSQKRKSKKAA